MSSHPLEPDGANDTNRAENVKLWSCINCRRRKVRCDRRHPCAPCTRNKTECTFPLSGRLPRRTRDAKYANPPAQKKQAELLGRLRRLEAMVGDLGSQVEHAAVVSQGSPFVESSTSTTSATSTKSSETGRPDYRLALHDQSANGNPRTTRDAVQTGSGMTKGISESPQVLDESGHLTVDSNGDLVVGDRFWTVFCKEVRSSSSPFCIALPDGSRAEHQTMGLYCTFLAELYIRWSKFSKSFMGPQFPTSMGTAAHRQVHHLMIDVITASITFFSRIHLLRISRRICILCHHRCYFSGRSTWTMSIRS